MAGVYLSFPFCAQKCTYCNFASGVFPRELEQQYLEALAAEIRGHAWDWTPETVYIGGGTPSRLDPAAFAQLFQWIPGARWAEATIEAAPGDVTAEKAAAWRQAGLNRVSLGTQSFVPKELAQTGRRHTPEVVEREIETLRRAGISNINLDLIAGLPFQTVESFGHSLEWVLRLGVPHVSVYMLEVDQDSRLGKELIGGGVRYGAGRIPSDDEIVAMYELAIQRLGAAGLARYEISNFAAPGAESLHNLKYWRLEPYVGFGADAHSFDGTWRWQNAESADAYVASWRRGEPVCASRSHANVAEERFLAGLRLAGGVRLGPEEWSDLPAGLDRFFESGLLQREGDRLRLTDQGVLYSNEVLEEFVQL